jgi:hypothetical protein
MPYYPRGYSQGPHGGRRRGYFIRRVYRRHRRTLMNVAIVVSAVAGGLWLAKVLIA